MKFDYRVVFAALLMTPLVAACGTASDEPKADATTTTTTAAVDQIGVARLSDVERRHGVQLGVVAVDTATGRQLTYRKDERFPILSTFKTFAVAALLRAHPLSTGYFNQVIHYTKADLVANSPITGEHVATGLTVAELSEAAITRSDNTAGNQLLKLLGGPGEITRFARSIGDQATRLDRWETELNTALPGDERDTTTPSAIAGSYRALVLGDALAAPERDQLKKWLLANTTGATRIRAGLPAGWTTADKTGTGDYAAANDVAVTWPAGGGAPVLIAVLSRKSSPTATADSALFAAVTKVVLETLH